MRSRRAHGGQRIFAPIVLIKGDLNEEERAGGALLGGADGTALRASCTAIGYAPEDFCALAAVAGEGDDPALTLVTLPTEVFREALEALDPEAVLLLDATAADLMRETYAGAWWLSPILTPRCSSLDWWPMCWVVVYWRSMDSRPRWATSAKSSVCGPISNRSVP